MTVKNTIDMRNPKVVDKGTTSDIVPTAEISLLSEATKQALKLTGWSEGKSLPRDLLKAVTQPAAPLPAKPQAQIRKPMPIPPKVDLPPELAKLLDPGILALSSGAPTVTETKEEVKEAPAPIAGTVTETHHCKRCGHDQRVDDDTDPTNEDKLGFLQSLLGGLRFRKQIGLFGDKLLVTFRTLTAKEVDLAFTQLSYDVKKGGVVEEVQCFRTLSDYRLAMSLESLKSESGETIDVPEIMSDEFQVDGTPPGATKLLAVSSWVYENVLKTDQLRRVVGVEFFRFQRLVEKLEARATDSDFWKATGARR